ncbi:MAG TPA: hypothetical protein VIL37_00680 [Natronosporangium sp.]
MGGMPEEDQKRAMHQALVDRILTGPGEASTELRARAFAGAGLAPPLGTLIDQVVRRPAQVSEADLAAVTAAGVTEDQLFELVICAAVGHASRLYDAGLAALAEATSERAD